MPGSSQANGARYPTHPINQVPLQPQAYRTQGYVMKQEGWGALSPHPGDMNSNSVCGTEHAIPPSPSDDGGPPSLTEPPAEQDKPAKTITVGTMFHTT